MRLSKRELNNKFLLLGLMFYCGFISFVVRMVSSGGHGLNSDLEGNVVNQILGMFLVLVPVSIGLLYKSILRLSFWKINFAITLFLIYTACTILWSVDPILSIKRVIALISLVGFCIYLGSFSNEIELYKAIGYSFGFAAILGLLVAMLIPGVGFISGGLREGAFLGIYYDKNGGARAYICAILLLFPFALKKERISLYCIFACILAILLARSASAIMLLIIGLGTASYYKLALKNTITASSRIRRVIISTAIYIAIALIIYHGYSIILELLDRDPTLTDRTIIWELLSPMIKSHFNLGYGFGAFWTSTGGEEFIERWKYIGNAHNGYIEMILHGGIVMVVMFSFLLLTTYFRLFNWLIHSKNMWFPCIAIGLVTEMIVGNYIAFILPNYRAYDFFVFLVMVVISSKKMKL